MASAPNYDPALMTVSADRKMAVDSLSKEETQPFFNRSVSAKYPPGSIFKTILGLVALQEGVSQPKRTIYCGGAYHYRDFRQGCRNHPIPYNMGIALQWSCNSYFLQLLRDVVEIRGFKRPDEGLELLVSHLRDFGLGVHLGLDLPGENKGNIPTSAYYDNLYKKGRWRSTYIMSIGIGQGELELTTLQMANLAAIVANKGHYYKPHLAIFDNSGSRIKAEKKQVRIDEEHFLPIIEGMSKAVTAGTAHSAYLYDIEICGKTGTSQNPHGEDHSVFFSFAPKDNPKIALAVYIENAGSGGAVAAPIAGLMTEKYLKDSIAPNRKWLENQMESLSLIKKSE